MDLDAAPLDADPYRRYGDVVAAAPAQPGASANAGTARRFDRLAAVQNLRPGAAPNLCLFRVQAQPANPFMVRLLERHRHSTQLFIPMAGAGRYLVIVCGGEGEPALETLRAFIARPDQGISYRRGIWHHPLIALDRQTDFACLVYEAGSADDCEERAVAPASVAY